MPSDAKVDFIDAFNESIQAMTAHIFQWVEWCLVVAAVQWIYQAHHIAIAGLVSGMLSVLLGFHAALVIGRSFPSYQTKWRVLVIAQAVLVALTCAAVYFGQSALVKAVVESQST